MFRMTICTQWTKNVYKLKKINKMFDNNSFLSNPKVQCFFA